MNNVTAAGGLDFTKKRRVPKSTRNIAKYIIESGDVLFNATNSPELVGKTAFFAGHNEPSVYSNHFLRLRPVASVLEGRYLARWLQLQFHRRMFQGMCRQWVNQATVSRDALLGLALPLPPLPEQRRIADVLDRAEALRAKRLAVLALLDSLTQSIFLEMFGDPVTKQTVLSACAEVVSGIAKGRKLNGRRTVMAPYLRVANVQAGYLNLDEIKTIEALPHEVPELRLMPGDVVMTEGGDYDKLGRGALWEGQIPDCIHQNHVFRVRVDQQYLIPRFFNDYLQTSIARKYFLSCAKKTTNLASINMTQLRALPVPLPPLPLQQEFARRVAAVEQLRTAQRASLAKLDELFASLQHRAFRGEL
jgi:type I restriction enzyme S subunit